MLTGIREGRERAVRQVFNAQKLLIGVTGDLKRGVGPAHEKIVRGAKLAIPAKSYDPGPGRGSQKRLI